MVINLLITSTDIASAVWNHHFQSLQTAVLILFVLTSQWKILTSLEPLMNTPCLVEIYKPDSLWMLLQQPPSTKLHQLHQSLSWFQLTTFRLCLTPHRLNMPHWLEDCPTIWQRFEISAYISKLRKVEDCITWSPIQPKVCPWAISDVQFEAYQGEVPYLHHIFPKRRPFVIWFNQGRVHIG